MIVAAGLTPRRLMERIDISLLADPGRITAVWVGGRQVKGDK
jgi:hypothetical protein